MYNVEVEEGTARRGLARLGSSGFTCRHIEHAERRLTHAA